MPFEKTVMTTAEAAQYVGLSKFTLERDRSVSQREGTPPQIPYVKYAKGTVRYKISDLDAFLEASTVR